MEELDEKIEKYVLGQLGASEKRLFEAEMSQNPALATEVAEQRTLLTGLRDAKNAASFRTLLGEIANENRAQTPVLTAEPGGAARVVPMRRRLFSAIAIAASLALAFFGWKFFGAKTASSEELFAANFTQPDRLSMGGTRGKATPTGDSLAIAAMDVANDFYQKKDFKNSLAALDRALETAQAPAKRTAALRAKGEILLIEKRWVEAEAAFLKMPDGTADERDWFVALAVLAQPERRAEAKVLFEKYANNPQFAGPRQERTKQILKDLN